MHRKINWLAIAVIVLVLLNIGLMASIWLQKSTVAGIGTTATTGQPPRGGPGAMIIRELGFDSLQRLRFDSLRNDHHSRTEAYRAQMRDLKERFFAGLHADEPPSDSLNAAIGALQARIDRNTYEHFRLVRALCNGAQKERFE
ncbi:MAG: periplasmic heavy metal sensor [Chitinophagaceae bacterium]|nr:MAG: periplasmic heavy metal sensor [Chitinophagaceae bacterium]